MIPTSGHVRCIRDSGDFNRNPGVSQKPAPELAVLVASPAHDGAACKDGAGMGITRVQFNGVSNPQNRYWNIAVNPAPVTELAPVSFSPAHDRPGIKQGAGVRMSSVHNRGVRDSGDRYRDIRVGLGPVPELTVSIISPTLN